MSKFNTITSLAESPLAEGLLYVGTDDGLIQVSENGGTTWRKSEVSSLPGVPQTAFINDIKADHGPDSLGVLTSARITNEENYIAQKFARAVLKTNSVDHCARL